MHHNAQQSGNNVCFILPKEARYIHVTRVPIGLTVKPVVVLKDNIYIII